MSRSHLILFAGLVVLCAGCDHAAKHVAETALEGRGVVSLLGGVVRFELAENPGAFLSMGANLPTWLRTGVLMIGVPLMLGALCYTLLRQDRIGRWEIVAAAAMAGGGLANWIDRLMDGGTVTDYVSIGVGSLRTGIFNFADVAVMAGLAMFLVLGWREEPSPE